MKIINISIFSFFSTEMTPVGQFLEVWRYIAIGVASLFLLWQMVAYVKFSHQWASSWYQASVEAKSTCRRVCWLLLIWTVSVLCLFGAVVSFIGMFYIYSETMRKSSNRKWDGSRAVLVIFFHQSYIMKESLLHEYSRGFDSFIYLYDTLYCGV